MKAAVTTGPAGPRCWSTRTCPTPSPGRRSGRSGSGHGRGRAQPSWRDPKSGRAHAKMQSNDFFGKILLRP